MISQSFQTLKMTPAQSTYDVVICGGGLAGLTLARQLKLESPELSILILDRLSHPLPNASFKVGESTVEVGSFYLTNVLQLTDYFEKNHLHKLGLRFFFGNPQGAFKERPEIGLSDFKAPWSYQIDRGILENDLRQYNAEQGINILENCQIKDILLSEDNDLHKIIYKPECGKPVETINARWVIDAMGRRRFLQKKLGLTKPNIQRMNAVWFRIEGRIDVEDLVPQTEQQWHARVPNKIRYYSTNHLCGQGYWIWVIPLSSGFTSIGIVAAEDFHPFQTFNTYQRACEWLQKHEPVWAAYLQDRQPQDFRKMPNYSYSSTQVFSQNRWACTGVAGTFIDPLYSLGIDLIGFANCLTTDLIKRDFNGSLTAEKVDRANLFVLTYNDQLTWTVQKAYHLFGQHSLASALKLLWDTLAGWALTGPQMFNLIFLEPEKQAKIQQISGKFLLLSSRIQRLFQDWSTQSLQRLTFEFIDYGVLPFVKEIRSRNLQPNKTEQELINDHIASMEILEEFAQVIFLLALEDTMPEQLSRFSSPIWLNVWAISLDVNRWEDDGLFQPKSKPRDLHRFMDPLRKLLTSSPSAPKQPVSLTNV